MTWRQYHQSNIWLTLLISLKVPLITVHDQPYLISVLSKSIEIRTDEPSVLIQVFPPLPSVIFFIWPLPQTVEVPRPRLATRAAQGRVYIAAQGLVRCHASDFSNIINWLLKVWLLTMVPVTEQVPQLLRDKQFELVSLRFQEWYVYSCT